MEQGIALPLSVYIFLSLELLAVGWLDYKYKIISNNWSLLNLVLCPLLYFFMKEFYPFSLEIFYYPGIVLFFGFFLFAMKVMGGGDAKFLATFYLLLPVSIHKSFLIDLLSATIVVAGFFFLINSIKNFKVLIVAVKMKDRKLLKSCYGTRFSYAPVIFLAWIILGWKNGFFF